MNRLAGLWRRLRSVLLRGRVERELEDELRFHVDMEMAELTRSGVPLAEARRQALRAFGGVDRYAEESRDARGVAWLDELRRDARIGLRQLWRNPQFSAAAILTLGIGVGATTAIFTAVDTVLLRSSPFATGDRLVVIWETDRASGTLHEPASWPDIVDMRERATSFVSIAALMGVDGTLTGDGPAERVSVLAVTANVFEVLGVSPLAGRVFEAGSGPLAGAAHGMLSERYWRSRFNADRAIVGSTLMISGRPITITGVLPAEADLGVAQIHARADYSVPIVDPRIDLWLAMDPTEEIAPRQTHPFLTIGRLDAGVPLARAQAELDGLMAELEARYPENAGRGAHLELHSAVTFGPVRPVLRVLMGGVLLVLLIACVNVANLLLARTASRTREVALRSALGAGAARIRRQFLMEGLVLATAGSMLGIVIAHAGLRAVIALAPADVPLIANASLDLRIFVFTAVITLLMAVAFALTPTFGSAARDIRHALGSQATTRTTESRESRRFRSALVVSEVAFAVALAIGAVLMVRSLSSLSGVNPGFRAEGLLKAEYQLPEARYPLDRASWPDLPLINDFHARLLDDVRALPGVTHAALAARHPLDPGFTNSFVIVGREAESADFPEIRTRMISDGYLETADVPLLSGRAIERTDVAGQPFVGVINRAAAERYFDGDPVGQTLRFWGIPWRIIGVIGDERFQGLAAAPEPAVYVPVAQTPASRATLLVRSDGDPTRLAPRLHAALARLDPEVALTGVETMERTLQTSIARPRFTAVLLALFGAVAILLALIGVYGVLSYTVAQRSGEMGIRLALGASRHSVVALVFRDGLRFAALGVLIGLAGAAAGARLLSGILFGVAPHDTASFVAVGLGVLLLAAGACALPAIRAARNAPLTALRSD
jgi:predicted permease